MEAFTEAPAPRGPRYRSLDVWRGLAALLVLVYHSTPYAADARPHEQVRQPASPRPHCRMVPEIGQRGIKGGCVIGNLSTALSDTHDAFRRRLAECFDEMALEFKPYLDAAVEKHRPRRRVDTWALARYILGIVEGSIMLARTRRDGQLMARNFDYAKEHLKWFLRA